MATYKNILKYGTLAAYKALVTASEIDEDVLYFCTDEKKLYKGTVDFTDRFVSVTAATLPAASAAIPGNIYYVSDEHKFKTLIGNAYVEIGNPIDAVGSGTTSTITASSADDHVPSAKNVYLYGQEILEAAQGGSGVVKAVGNGSEDGVIQVTMGDDSTSEFAIAGVLVSVSANASAAATLDVLAADDTTASTVVVPGVLTGAAAGTNAGEIDLTNSTGANSTTITVPGVVASIANTTTAAVLAVTPTTGTAYDVTLNGVVTTPTWNNTTRSLTLPVAGGEAVVVDIGKDIFVQAGYYDTTTQSIVLILNNDDPEHPENPIIVPAASLVDAYTGGETTTATVTVSTTNEITAAVKLDQHAGNAITIAADTVEDNVTTKGGLRVDLSAYALDADLTALAAATAQWGTF